MNGKVNAVTLGLANLFTKAQVKQATQGVVKSISGKVSLPVTNSTPNYGTAGQFAISDGNGGITWKTLVEAEGVDY